MLVMTQGFQGRCKSNTTLGKKAQNSSDDQYTVAVHDFLVVAVESYHEQRKTTVVLK